MNDVDRWSILDVRDRAAADDRRFKLECRYVRRVNWGFELCGHSRDVGNAGIGAGFRPDPGNTGLSSKWVAEDRFPHRQRPFRTRHAEDRAGGRFFVRQ
jgi:hypothetical protein